MAATFLAPAVVAAVVSAIVALVGIWISRGTSLRLHQERAKTDHELARARFESDVEIATKKFELDLQLADWQRRSEFAEELLTNFYKARDLFKSARNAFSLTGEGVTRPDREVDTEETRRRKDAIYAPFERLSRERDFLSSLHAKRFRAEALFGAEAVKPFLDFFAAYNDVQLATEELLETFGRHDSDPEWTKKFKRDIGWGRKVDDPVQPFLEEAVLAIERICRPVIEARPNLTSAVPAH